MNPLTSILIPAYKTDYFETALKSAVKQTYPNIEIIICDDCPSDDIKRIVERYKDLYEHIIYYKNPSKKGGLLNYIQCFKLSNGIYIKFLNDEDVLSETCVEQLVGAYCVNPQKKIGAVASRRTLINSNGERLRDRFFSIPLSPVDCEINGRDLIRLLLFSGQNIVGEPSAVLFRKADVKELFPHFMSFHGFIAPGMGDIVLLINLLMDKNLIYLSDSLSFFRIHEKQRQRDREIRNMVGRSLKDLRRELKRTSIYDGSPIMYYKCRSMHSAEWKKKSLSYNHLFTLIKTKILKLLN
jgi:glycosyltransferase involved in cell wall biosynthesis